MEEYGNRERVNRMGECREYEQEIDLKELLFHILCHWRSVLLVALAAGALWAGYAVWYNMESLPEKRAEVQEALEQQVHLRDLLKAQEQGQEAAAGGEQSAELLKAGRGVEGAVGGTEGTQSCKGLCLGICRGIFRDGVLLRNGLCV